MGITFEVLLEQVQKLSMLDRLRLMEIMAAELQTDFSQSLSDDDWRTALHAAYGSTAHDPLERPAQAPLEAREKLD